MGRRGAGPRSYVFYKGWRGVGRTRAAVPTPDDQQQRADAPPPAAPLDVASADGAAAIAQREARKAAVAAFVAKGAAEGEARARRLVDFIISFLSKLILLSTLKKDLIYPGEEKNIVTFLCQFHQVIN